MRGRVLLPRMCYSVFSLSAMCLQNTDALMAVKTSERLIVAQSRMDNPPSVSDRSTMVYKINANPTDSGTAASKLPLKGNVDRQHVTLTVLF
jgi:hypothetical protein